MGVPPDAILHIPGDNAKLRRAAQNSAIGNGFHVPTVMVILFSCCRHSKQRMLDRAFMVLRSAGWHRA